MNNYNIDIKKLLGIEDENIKILGVEDVTTPSCENSPLPPKVLFNIVYAKLEYKKPYCTNCGVKCKNSVIKNGCKSSCIPLQKSCGTDVYLHLKKQRYMCRNCQKHTTAKTNIVEENCYISLNLKREVIYRLTLETSRKAIAIECGISDMTVYNIQKSIYKFQTKNPSKKLPEYLCFDEFRSTNDVEGKLSFIYCDALNHKVIDILENHRTNTIKKHFINRYDFKDRLNVKLVCSDMNAGYVNMIKDLFPNASIVIDRFHIVQALNNALNELRIKIMKEIKDKDELLYKQYKTHWKLILMKEDNLPIDDYGKKAHFKQWITSKEIVLHLINKNSLLKDAYYTVQMLYDTIKAHNYKGFFEIIETNKNTIANEFKATFETFIKHKPYIENSLRYNLSNGAIEGIINKIKNIKRDGYGYRNFFSLKAKILLVFNLGYSNTSRNVKQLIDYDKQVA